MVASKKKQDLASFCWFSQRNSFRIEHVTGGVDAPNTIWARRLAGVPRDITVSAAPLT
jgi:hypothetical protein